MGGECSPLAPWRGGMYAVAIVDTAVVEGVTINQITQFARERKEGEGGIQEIGA